MSVACTFINVGTGLAITGESSDARADVGAGVVSTGGVGMATVWQLAFIDVSAIDSVTSVTWFAGTAVGAIKVKAGGVSMTRCLITFVDVITVLAVPSVP